MRLKDKVAVIIGAGQNPGETIGNGRATALRFAQEGARILAVDRRLEFAEQTAQLARAEGADCITFEADVTQEATLAAAMVAAQQRWGHIDILHYNVGISIEGNDAPVTEITEAAFDRICQVNLRGAVMSCKHALPIMRSQRSGVILMISSISAYEIYPFVTYKATKGLPGNNCFKFGIDGSSRHTGRRPGIHALATRRASRRRNLPILLRNEIVRQRIPLHRRQPL